MLSSWLHSCRKRNWMIHEEVAKYPDLCGLAITGDDAFRLKNEGKLAFLIGIENGYGIGNDLSNIK